MDREKYLERLEQEHRDIKRLFRSLDHLVETGEIKDAGLLKEKMDELKNILVDHVKGEDDVFYHDLRKKAVQMDQDVLIPALDMFMNSMHDISVKAIGFFKEYGKENNIIDRKKNFIAELNELRDTILKRISSEEGSLFYIYRAYFFD